ncbi:hypothetical protein I6F35_03175 [Bradyrhizobium sp. BRP22]|nr:hypothetical protein [Bradyrhizobium sp. BRP22]
MIDPEVVLATRGDRAPPTPRTEVNHAPAPQSYAASSVAAPSLDSSFRVTASDHIQLPSEPSAFAKWAKRATMAFLFALISAFAAAAWKHHGDTAKQMIAEWIPQFSLLSSPSEDATASAEQPAPPAVQTATEQPPAPAVQTASTDQAVAQPEAPTQAQPAEAAAPTTAAALPADSSQLLQSMAHDLATMGQQIQQLKASIEQLKSGQDQMARDIARNAEARVSAQAVQPRTAAPPPRPVAAPVRRPKPPAYPPAQTAAAAPPPLPPPSAPAPVQTVPAPQPQAQDGGPVVRPPMPVR